ncbi:hypothetical protein [Chelativorans sp.]|uniref:hypothetical protein n=1 Tax=Chelativorans sp. TaxID=2203393 RepID=UPI002812140A|nr:hypothetical protein [Chelativorans sp.]
MKRRFAVRFPGLLPDGQELARRHLRGDPHDLDDDGETDASVMTRTVDAPARLAARWRSC